MSDFLSEDLQGILREQNELRLKLIALDRKIESLRSAKPIPAKQPAPAAEKIIAPTMPREIPSPPPLPTTPAAPVQKSSWEFQLGTVWLVRIGIVILLTGLVFLGNYAYHHIVPRIGPWVKLALLYFLGGTLAWLGARLEKSTESLRNYGRVLLAGGVALLYYTTYGAAFVEKLRVIGSPLIGGLLLLGGGGVVVWLAEKRQAQSVALMAILLSYYTAAINPLGVFSLYSSLLLTVAAVYFLRRHRWTTVGFLGLLGTYGSYAFWHFNHGSSGGQALGFLLCYWVLFTAAVFLSRSTQFTPEKRTPFLTLNNAAFYGLVFQILHAHYPEWTGRFSLGFGAVLLGLAWFAKKRQTEDLFLDGAYLIQGLGVLTFGLITELNGYQLSLALAIQGTLMLFSINRRHGWIFEIGAALATLLALGIDFGQNYHPHQQVIWWTLTGIFIADAWLVKNYKKRVTICLFSWAATAYCLLAIWKLGLILLRHFPMWTAQTNYPLATLVLLGIATLIRLRELAVTGQILAGLAAGSYVLFSFQNPDTRFALLGIIFVPLFLLHWWQRQKEGDLWHLGQTLFSALFLAAASRWIYDHSSSTHLGFYLGCLALGVAIYGTFTSALTLALFGQILLFATAGLFFFQALILKTPVTWFDVALLLLYIANERMVKTRFSYTILPKAVRQILIFIAVSGFWLEWNRWLDFSGSHFPKTLAWATLGTVALCLGLAIRERTYRLCGLALLAMATLRIFLNDIWGLDPIFRILSFIVLGVVLLGIGFIYNKFADKLKEWL